MKKLFNWLFIISVIATIICALVLMIVEWIFNWNHSEFTRMMMFHKFFYWDISLFIGGILCLIFQFLSDRSN
jgi:hypothetical protein